MNRLLHKVILLAMVLALAIPRTASAQVIDWQKAIGGNSTDDLTSMQKTSDGGFILGGTSISSISGDKSQNCRGSLDYWIVKIDSSRNIQWEKTIGGNKNDYLSSVKQTFDGGYILGGYSDSGPSGDKTSYTWGGSNDYWVVKVDATGNIEWQKTYGGLYDDWLISVVLSDDGGFLLGGSSNSNIYGDKTENSRGLMDYWIVKIDSIGDIQWQKTIGGSGGDQIRSMQKTKEGGYILAGNSYSNVSGEKGDFCRGSDDYWIVKIDMTGNIEWQKTMGGYGMDRLDDIKQTNDGGYIIGGHSFSDISYEKAENGRGATDYWIIKTDSIGNIEWQKTLGGSNWEYYGYSSQTSDGGYILGGRSPSLISGDKTEDKRGGYDYWIIKTGATGNIEWQKTIGGNLHDNLQYVEETSPGVYLLGGTSGSDLAGDKTVLSKGADDFWLVQVTSKFNAITGSVFLDLNGNQVQDAGEPALKYNKVTESNTGRIGFSDAYGKYSVSVLNIGSYTVHSDSINNFSSVPLNHSAVFTSIQQIDSLNDFAFRPNSFFNNLCVTITPATPFRPGFSARYIVNYTNEGTNTINNCKLVFHPDTNVTYQGSGVTPIQIFADSVVWNIGTLVPFQSGSITVSVIVNVGTPISTMINSWVRIDPIIGDIDQACNFDELPVIVTGSYDPNDILVNPSTLLTSEFPNPPYLDYIIRFQNTGNDTAFVVKILNPLDIAHLRLNTLEYVTSSHNLTNLRFVNYSDTLEFIFDNIMLPDSNVNEPMSHGFVRYRIKPKTTLVVNDTIKNQAAIYFDFNAPVITNTATTIVVFPKVIPETIVPENGLIVFPNPTLNSLTIRGAGSELKITDTLGKVLFRATDLPTGQEHTLDVSRFPAGMYIVESGTARVKFLKM